MKQKQPNKESTLETTIKKIEKITVFNGSPRKARGNTHFITQALLEGAVEAGATAEVVFLYDQDIKPCYGEFHCWLKHPGKCFQKDDVAGLYEKVKASDLVVFATPLYADNVTAVTKALIDRIIPLVDPHMDKDGNQQYDSKDKIAGAPKLLLNYGLAFFDPHFQKKVPGEYRHRKRIAENGNIINFPKIGIISNCGLPEQTHFEVLKLYFRRLARNLSTEVVAEVYRGGGELLADKSSALQPTIHKYQDLLRQAGRELVTQGTFSVETKEQLELPLIPHDLYAALANASFDRALGQNDHFINKIIGAYEKREREKNKLKK